MSLRKIWHQVLLLLSRLTYKKASLRLTMVKTLEEGNHLFRIMDNGHDYEVSVYVEDRMVYQNLGFETLEDAEAFVEMYKSYL